MPASNRFAHPISVRPMQPADIAAARALSQAQGWPHTEADWAMHLALGEGHVATHRDGGIIGTILWWAWGSDAGTLGLIIVDQHYRGRGIGQRLMSHALTRLGKRRLQLVSTQAGMALYRGAGFQPVAQIVQLQGQLGSLQEPPGDPRLSLKPLTGKDLPALHRLDTAATRMDRTTLLQHLTHDASGYILERDQHAVGFALRRRSGKGMTVGPVVARDQAEAKLLLSQLLAGSTGFHRIDVPREAGALISWLQTGGLTEVDTGTLMQNIAPGMAPRAPVHRYGLASQALG